MAGAAGGAREALGSPPGPGLGWPPGLASGMSPTLLRLAVAAASAGLLTASELAPSADLGALPEIAPRTWFQFNAAPDDQAVAAQVPRRRETAIGAAAVVSPEHGLAVFAEGVWSPVRAPREDPAVRVDELLGGIGVAIERPGETFGWRLAVTGGVRVLTNLHSAELDRIENQTLRGGDYHAEGQPEDPSSVDPVLALRYTALIRLTAADPLRHAPVDLALGARAMRVFPFDGAGDSGTPDLRLNAKLLLPTRTTVSWFGLTWQQMSQPASGSRALAAIGDEEAGVWFDSGGALRLGAKGDWLVEVGSAVDLRAGVAIGTLGAVHTGDPPRATADGTGSLALVVRRGDYTSAGIATGDQLTLLGPAVLRSEIRTLIGDRHEPAGTVTADAVSLDGMLRIQLPFRPVPLVAIGPEAALGLGLRRDAMEFPNQTFVSASRIELVGDVGVAGRVATGWKDGIASLEGTLGWGWWQALGGAESLSGQGVAVPLASSDGGLIMRFGLLALF